MNWVIECVQLKPKQIWSVGFFTPDGEWRSVFEHMSLEDAARRCNYLNGGAGRLMEASE